MKMELPRRTRRERRHPFKINRRIVMLLELATDAARQGDAERATVLLDAALREVRAKAGDSSR